MAVTAAIEGRCGAKTRSGGHCAQRAGWGTDHPGFGTCRNHLGSTAQHGTHAARLEALAFARGQLGQELEIDPLEGVLLAVRLAYGIVDHLRHRLHVNATDELRDAYSRALMDYTRICDIAIKAGVSERQIKIVERLAEQLSLAAEDALAVLGLDAAQRALFGQAFEAALARLETPVIDSTATDLAA